MDPAEALIECLNRPAWADGPSTARQTWGFLIAPLTEAGRGQHVPDRRGMDGPGPARQPDLHPDWRCRRPARDRDGRDWRQPAGTPDQCLDRLPGGLRLGPADLPGRRGDRPRVAPAPWQGGPLDRPPLFPAAVRGRLRLRLLRRRLEPPVGRDRRDGAVDDIGRGGVRGDDRIRPVAAGYWQD